MNKKKVLCGPLVKWKMLRKPSCLKTCLVFMSVEKNNKYYGKHTPTGNYFRIQNRRSAVGRCPVFFYNKKLSQ